MNRDQAKALLPIITAFAEGKTVQFDRNGLGDWREDYSLLFICDASRYRVKPEPRKFGVVLRNDGTIVHAVEAADLVDEVTNFNVNGAIQSKPYTGIVVVEQL